MLTAIKHGLGGLADFSGRDARQAFWYYVLFVVVVSFILSTLLSSVYVGPIMADAMRAGVEAAKDGAPPPDPSVMFARLPEMMHAMTYLGVGLGVLKLVLLSAALVRRCHDSGLSGMIAAIPLGLYALSLLLLVMRIDSIIETQMAMVGKPEAAMAALTGPAMMITLLSYGALLIGIVLAARKSTDGPNRFGDTPFTA
jgi:uncharacterized membrane protein YhaH (DUF805 family)